MKSFQRIFLLYFLLVATSFFVVEAAYDAKCQMCHPEQVKSFESSFHNTAWNKLKNVSQDYCSTCHGGTAKHLETMKKEVIFSFKDKQNGANADGLCLKCHGDNGHFKKWAETKHNKNGVHCISCHKVHIVDAKEYSRKQCLTCHTLVNGKIKGKDKHPTVGGGMPCIACHSPHAPKI
ncbi:MAG: hypothetical protein A2504_10910 [Bdellovibrionales bacterium RIFOXYD12_FULL_39_22]|nr:MAG: hypothetical protein A2385_09475 [Bdellovibrionales bacterium RIFOXYB1_FULL_39_21]OFZ44189.1 MAG: hypothetical protein A2485_07095 [Bdellovibrionales bacterium RIFOXYC12_FULL_39_17]OFZ46731.1 MAG: hypothetical protein A2404_04330 [Bdellovibrionales bacterium RIFOXYC1_FULL_39_130]OFZ75992.1 MAG: hypothetical protein A2560_02820 [Bdellovibrionales bacterium RIFOXYD1_FULL_39_84]OFZ95411.1 MAG: hypothetical protein A2504_10910 [Bdellovibrionales bacterium RIFOXYD12_FULL_39_22]HLE09861.1 cy